MSALFNCSLICTLISIWGALQLGFMSVLYYMESVSLIEDCEEHSAHGYDEFIEKTKKNYKATSINCMIAAAIYVGSLLLSVLGILRARKKERLKAARLLDDELSCLQEAAKPEVKVKTKEQSPGLMARILKKKKPKEQAKAPSPTPPAYKPPGKINIKDSNELEEKRKSLAEEEEMKKKTETTEKKKEGKEGKKKKKRDKSK